MQRLPVPALGLRPEPALRHIESADVLKGERIVAINHNGTVYRLQATHLGKLILTK
jgi:hemin uptake protein HemP